MEKPALSHSAGVMILLLPSTFMHFPHDIHSLMSTPAASVILFWEHLIFVFEINKN